MALLSNLNRTQALLIDDDIRHLEVHGVWPGGSAPCWARSIGEILNVAPANRAVLDTARSQIIKWLRDCLESDPLRNGSRVSVSRELLEHADLEDMPYNELLGWAKRVVNTLEEQEGRE